MAAIWIAENKARGSRRIKMFGKRCLIQTDSPELARKIKYMLERQRIPYEEKVKDGMSAEQLMSRLLSGGEERADSGQVRHISLYIHKCDVRQAEELVRAVKKNLWVENFMSFREKRVTSGTLSECIPLFPEKSW